MSKKILKFVVIGVLFFCLSFSVFAQNNDTEALVVFKSGSNLNEILQHTKHKKSSKDQTYAMKKYTEPIVKNIKGVKTSEKYAINNFIVYGTQSTQKLSAQKRYELVLQYKTKYKKIPKSQADWVELIKIANPIKKDVVTTGPWVIVFTNRGTPLPDENVNLICNEIKLNVTSWINRELAKYQITKPFDDIVCSRDQASLSGNLLNGEEVSGEGQTFTNPINSSETIKFLENKILSLTKAKYATVFHYLVPTNLQFTNYANSSKYDFEFITRYNLPDGGTVFVPPLTDVDTYGQELAHEFMHKLGATDKYGTGFQQACRVDPLTGQQYSGYDIMCHRISINGAEGFATPKFSELIISEATAQEIKKQKTKEDYLKTTSLTVISPNGGEKWKSGKTYRIKWDAKGISSIRLNLYNPTVKGSGSSIYITPDNKSISASVGFYDWVIPPLNQLPGGTAGNYYKIRINDVQNPTEKNDESNSLFSITQ